jgi:hypothetical protein
VNSAVEIGDFFLTFSPIHHRHSGTKNSFKFTSITPIQPLQQKIIVVDVSGMGFPQKSIHELRILITKLTPSIMASL